jgi:hypothetical protein
MPRCWPWLVLGMISTTSGSLREFLAERKYHVLRNPMRRMISRMHAGIRSSSVGPSARPSASTAMDFLKSQLQAVADNVSP